MILFLEFVAFREVSPRNISIKFEFLKERNGQNRIVLVLFFMIKFFK